MAKSTKKIRSQINLAEKPQLNVVKPFLTTPLEITRDRLRLMNMVDENIIVFDGKQFIKQDCE